MRLCNTENKHILETNSKYTCLYIFIYILEASTHYNNAIIFSFSKRSFNMYILKINTCLHLLTRLSYYFWEYDIQ